MIAIILPKPVQYATQDKRLTHHGSFCPHRTLRGYIILLFYTLWLGKLRYVKKKKHQAQGRVACPQDNKPRLDRSFRLYQECDLKPMGLEFPDQHW